MEVQSIEFMFIHYIIWSKFESEHWLASVVTNPYNFMNVSIEEDLYFIVVVLVSKWFSIFHRVCLNPPSILYKWKFPTELPLQLYIGNWRVQSYLTSFFIP